MRKEQFQAFTKRFTDLIKMAEALNYKPMDHTLVLIYLTMTCSPAVQVEIDKEIEALLKKWMSGQREANEIAEQEADRDWFRNFEWPEDFDK
jgi:hypothetical protein